LVVAADLAAGNRTIAVFSGKRIMLNAAGAIIWVSLTFNRWSSKAESN
jgi:hypothetical protein